MPLKTPAFWYAPRGLYSLLLTPISWLYQIGHRLNQARQNSPYKPSIPVICVGNAVAGGSGKTPTVISLVKLLKEQGVVKNPFILTRGYGGQITEATLVDPSNHSAVQVGDEPLLLSHYAPTIISANREDGAKLAEENSADLIIMDDGLQNNHIVKTLSLLVIDRSSDFGNGKTIPAGPLREPLGRLLPKVQGIICIGHPFHSDLAVFVASITPEDKLDTTKIYIAFAGLGRPEKFKMTLESLKTYLVGWHEFADHHHYTDKDIAMLRAEAAEKNAILVTTEKDHVRLPADFAKEVETLPITLTLDDPKVLGDYIAKKIKGVPS